MMSSDQEQTKTVLFCPLNSPGHINSSLGIADRIRAVYKHRTVFMLLGPMIGDSVRQHGHELVILEEANPFEDYEILDGEDPTKPVDEELMRRLGRTKQKFPGVFKWPQILSRHQAMLRLDPVDSFVRACSMMEKTMVDEMIDNQENYVAKIESIKPDLIIIDSYYVPPCIVSQKRIPWVRLFSANPMMILESCLPNGTKPPPMAGVRLYSLQERERLRNEEPAKWQMIIDDWRKANERINAGMAAVAAGSIISAYLAEQGCEPLPPGKQAPDSPHLNIYMFPKAIDYDRDTDIFRYPPRWFRCDSLMRKQETPSDSDELRAWAQKLESALINKESLIYFALGSLASGILDLVKRYVEMFATDKRRLYVVSKGVNGDKFELCPDNMIGGNYLPQNYFLQRADLAIVHGGNNSITECLYHGLPIIVLPVFGDQLDSAQRIEDLGLGRRLNANECTRDELIKTIDEVLQDQALIDRVRLVGKEMQQRDDLGKVTSILEKLMAEGKLDDEYLEKMRHDEA